MTSRYPQLRVLRLTASALRRIATIGVLSLHVSALAQSGGALSLDEAVRLATAQSSQISAAQAQGRAAREMAVAAAQLPDPVLKLGTNNLPIDGPERFSIGRDFMTMRSVGLMQEFTRAGKRDARTARAQTEAVVALTNQHQVTAELQRDAALAWLERSFQHSLRDLLVDSSIEADRQVQAAEVIYRSGRGAQADVFAARTEVEMLRDRIDQTDRAIAVATTELARWIGAAAQRPSGLRPAFTAPAWTTGDFTQHLMQHPEITASAQQKALAEANVAIANANRQSDWTVELMYSQRGSGFSNMVSLNVSVPLQWDQTRRQNRELAAAQALVERAAAELENRTRIHEAEVRAMLHEWRIAQQRLARYDASLLPLARQRAEASLTAYRAGTASLTAVLAARRAQIDTLLERLRIEMDIARLWAQLNYLVPHGGYGQDASAAWSQP